MGVEAWALAAQSDEWTEWALCLMSIEHKGQERQHRKGGRK
jgi:hypothetical protein